MGSLLALLFSSPFEESSADDPARSASLSIFCPVACARDEASSGDATGELSDAGCPAETREERETVFAGCTLTAKASASGISLTALAAEASVATAGGTGSSADGSPMDGASARVSANSAIRFAILFTRPAHEPGGSEGPVDVAAGVVGTSIAVTTDGAAGGGVRPRGPGVFFSSWDLLFSFAASPGGRRLPGTRGAAPLLVEALSIRPCLIATEKIDRSGVCAGG